MGRKISDGLNGVRRKVTEAYDPIKLWASDCCQTDIQIPNTMRILNNFPNEAY
jgi:hypothetical protein